MCGIAGLITFDNEQVDPFLLAKIRDAMTHRGPDSGDQWISENGKIGLAHRRLSIIDLEQRSNQPMSSVDQKIWIVFNGEIYNYNEVKRQLTTNHSFRTESDTEVIIYAYREWGMDIALQKFSGMFAFCLIDLEKNLFFLVRDRFGKKPLFYSLVNHNLAFASESQALSSFIKLEPDEEAIYNYLTIGTTFAPKSFFKNISKVSAGTYLRSSLARIDWNIVNYYDIADKININSTQQSTPCPSDEFEAHLQRAMDYRKVADVPIGLALSGGIDSSLNAYFFRELKPLCISLSWQGENVYDESAIATIVAKQFNLPIEIYKIDSDNFQDALNEYLTIQKDSPIGDINAILIFMMSRFLRSFQYKILVVGEGGDEIGGYTSYNSAYRAKKLYQSGAMYLLSLFKNYNSRIKKISDIRVNEEILPLQIIFAFSEWQKKAFWNRPSTYNTYDQLGQIMSEITQGYSPYDRYLRKITNLEYKVRLPELILPRLDYPSMAASVEARSPFLDSNLIEMNSSIPWEKRMNGGISKTYLRNLAARYLPSQVLNHPKIGFTHVMEPFLSKGLPQAFKKEIIDKDAPIKAYIRVDFLKWACENLRNENLWRIYSLNRWLQNW